MFMRMNSYAYSISHFVCNWVTVEKDHRYAIIKKFIYRSSQDCNRKTKNLLNIARGSYIIIY